MNFFFMKGGVPDRADAASGNIEISSEYLDLEKEIIPSDKLAQMEEFERRKRLRKMH